MSDEHLIMEQQYSPVPARDGAFSSIKTIALHILDDEFHDQRIDTALSLARACSAHVNCLHVTPIEAYGVFDKFGGILMLNDVTRVIDERNAALQMRVEERLRRECVSWSYEQTTANVGLTLITRAALADLLIVARQPAHHDYAAPTIGFLGELILRSRTPLLVPALPPDEFDPAGTALIAWDGSVEAANAVRSALGLLRMASDVRVIQIHEQSSARKRFPAMDVLEYLSRHGIHADLKVEAPPAGHPGHDVVSAMILAEASGAGASYIVMGGYGHKRVAEYVFGGVTNTFLKSCPVSLLITH